MERTIIENQVIIMKALLLQGAVPSVAKDLKDRIMISETRLRITV